MTIFKERELFKQPEKGRYPIDTLESSIIDNLKRHTGYGGNITLTDTPGKVRADYGVQLAQIARTRGENPVLLAQNLTKQGWNHPYIRNVESQGPYLNFQLEYGRFGNDVVTKVLTSAKEYGKERVGQGQKIVVDMSSPNIAKRMSYGHLRSTIIGDAVSNLYESQGHEVVRDNHIGDWGTQFGKQIAAIKLWGDEKALTRSKEPVGDLQVLYQKFHEEVEKNPELENLGREWFLKLEQGDKEAKRLWKMCIDLSMKEFQQVYKTLGVKFDVTLGESFYEKMLPGVMEEVARNPISSRSDGALVVNMEDEKLGVAIIQKSDGASVYMTRDLATAIYREEEMKANKAIYVVGEDQKLYFQQLFQILKRTGHDIGEESEHVYFGMVRMKEGKMSTRKGRTILLNDVIDEGLARERKVIKDRNPDLYRKPIKREQVIRQVAIGALKWNDLARDPKRSIEFDWNEALNFEGYSGPYVQYAAVRANSILDKAGIDKKSLAKGSPEGDIYTEETERDLIKKLATYPRVLKNAQEQNNPAIVASSVYAIAKDFNNFYRNSPVLQSADKNTVLARLKLVGATSQVIENGLAILGIEVPSEM